MWKHIKQGEDKFYGIQIQRFNAQPSIKDPEGLCEGKVIVIGLPLIGILEYRRTYANQDHPSFQSRDVF